MEHYSGLEETFFPQDQMTEQQPIPELDFPEELKTRARDFFNRAAEVAYTLNFDYAIELYLDGLVFWPDALEEGHYKLRDIAMRRQAAGGKKAGFGDSSKYKKGLGKTPKDHMLKAEYLLSKDPGNTGHMQDMVKAAVAGDYRKTANWMADMLFDHNLQRAKPSASMFVFLRDSYAKVENFGRALQACQNAFLLKPNDASLETTIRDLSAQTTMQQGKYDKDGDFRESMQDRNGQEKLQSQENVVRSDSVKADLITQARQEYEADPTVAGKISNLVAALSATERVEQENEAIEVLDKAFKNSGEFRWQQQMGEIRVKQWQRTVRSYREKVKANPDHPETKKKLAAAMAKALATELEHYRLCSQNYPTDMRIKFEYGRRLMQSRKYDEAIPVLQDARADPRHRIAAIGCIGQCFFHKEWYPDAVETFEQALEGIENKESNMAKELVYNLGRAHEANGNTEEALNAFRRVAQLDYNYADVRQRVDALRKKQNGNDKHE